MRKGKKKKLDKGTVRVIKIGKDALFEFIYENFLASQEKFLDVDPLCVANHFDMDFESGQFIFCARRDEDEDGNFIPLPREIDLKKVMQSIPDTTSTMLNCSNKYKDYTEEELIEFSKR